MAAFCLSTLVFCARFTGRLAQGSRVWRAWQALMAIIGIITVPQVLWGTFTASESLLPAAIAAIPGVHPPPCPRMRTLSRHRSAPKC